MLRIIQKITVSALLTTSFQLATAQQTHQKFVQEIDYLLSLPDGYTKDTTERWPLLVFLHGSGESGNDLEKVKTHGPPKLLEQGKKFPFIVVSPQAADARIGWEAERLYKMIQDIKEKYRVDNSRIYLTGLSMGGYGTWSLAIKHPEEFAAIVPISGGGDTAEIWKLRHTPVWCFHGALDPVVALENDQKMIGALKRYNPSVRFTIYPLAYHDAWTASYDNDSLYQWLLAQKKVFFKQVKINASLLEKYTGTFADAAKDTVHIIVDHDTLIAKTKGENIELRPASANLFFIKEDLPFDIRFIQDEKGIVRKFLYWGDKQLEFKKLP